MANFIEEFYYGNINPQARSCEASDFLKKELALLDQNEAVLTKKLTGEENRLFLAYANSHSVVNGESCLDSSIMGFRLGARFAYDTFCSDNSFPRYSLKE